MAVRARNIWVHGPMASAVAPITGIWGQSPSGNQGQSPWSKGQRSEAPLKLKHFWLLDVQFKPHIWPFFSKIWKR